MTVSPLSAVSDVFWTQKLYVFCLVFCVFLVYSSFTIQFLKWYCKLDKNNFHSFTPSHLFVPIHLRPHIITSSFGKKNLIQKKIETERKKHEDYEQSFSQQTATASGLHLRREREWETDSQHETATHPERVNWFNIWEMTKNQIEKRKQMKTECKINSHHRADSEFSVLFLIHFAKAAQLYGGRWSLQNFLQMRQCRVWMDVEP